MRALLDRIYQWSGYLAAFFLAAIAVTTVVQVVGRKLGMTIEMTEMAGFCLSASTFLGLAHTFRNGTHVRVSLLIQKLSGRYHRAAELWCCAVGAAALAFVTVEFALFTWESFIYDDISPGLLAIPFWIPQSGVVLGLACLTVALVDETVSVVRGRDPVYAENADSAIE